MFTVIVNIFLICGQTEIMDTIFNFIALGVISEIDNYYYESLPPTRLKNFVQNDCLKIKNRKLDFWERTRLGKALRIDYKLLRIFYVSLYYYFTPFITPMITYLVAGASKSAP